MNTYEFIGALIFLWTLAFLATWFGGQWFSDWWKKQ